MIRDLPIRARRLAPGVLIAGLVAVAAQFLSDHYAVPAMLMALLLGIAINFLSEEDRTGPGIDFGARSLLRLGVALLGARISAELLMELGGALLALVIGGVLLTILFGLAVGRLFGARWRFSLLTSGAVAICGASAAMAIAAILPRDERSEERLIFTVVGVTLLSTIAMIVYPIFAGALDLSTLEAGVFLGATIHDVAQVVGAGFSVSDDVGEVATLVKLVRVAMLAPIVIVAALAIRSFAAPTNDGTARPPLIPTFVLAFLVLAAVNSAQLLPAAVMTALGAASRWSLLLAIAAVGMKTNLKQVLSVGPSAIGLIVTETAFIAGVILLGLHLLI